MLTQFEFPRVIRFMFALGAVVAVQALPVKADEKPSAKNATHLIELERRVGNLEKEVEALKTQLANIQQLPTEQSWVERLKSLREHMHTAFSVGPELTLLDPDEGLEIVEDAWPEIKFPKVKTGILKTFAFSKALAPNKHPRLFQVLHLGMTDADPYIREYAASYLQEYALQDFSKDPSGYAAWYRQYGEKSPAEVLQLNQARVPEQLDEQLTKIQQAFRNGEMNTVQNMAAKMGDMPHPYAIPTLIGIIDADNSYDTVYGVGYFGLGRITDVRYSPYHDGAWWRRWWDENKNRFPENVQNQSVPELPKTEHGKSHSPFPEDMDTFEGKLRHLDRLLATGGSRSELWNLAEEIAEHKDPAAIPILIGVIDADNTYDTVYGVGYFGLGELTDVVYEETHDGAWWRKWWEQNKSQYPAQVQAIDIPDYSDELAAWKVASNKQQSQEALRDVADVPAEDLTVDRNEKMRYFLIGPRKGVTRPETGFKLVVIIPGGDGGVDFHPFVRQLFKHSLGDDYLAIQPVAFNWRPDQRITWPTRTNKVQGQKFATEDFVEAMVKDVAEKYPLDRNSIFTLSWSSGGPAGYAVSLARDTPVTGSYVAMSVFKPDTLPRLNNAGGQAYFIDHSPDDHVCPFRMAKAAQQALKAEGAKVRLNTYEGVHGWRGDVYGRVSTGIEWLEQQTAPSQ